MSDRQEHEQDKLTDSCISKSGGRIYAIIPICFYVLGFLTEEMLANNRPYARYIDSARSIFIACMNDWPCEEVHMSLKSHQSYSGGQLQNIKEI